MLILIADDDSDDLEFFMHAVREIDSRIVCILACNGIEAIQLLETSRVLPDYIFLDLNMPRMDGKACLRHIKKSPLYSSIPVIMYSTSRRPEDIEDTVIMGAAAFIVKPNKFGLLKEEIARVLQEVSPASTSS